MLTTPNMGLSKWDLLGDPYNHSQLAANFGAIDLHQHIAGQGRQIPTGGIQDDAISSVKIQNSAVTSSKIADGTIILSDLAFSTKERLSPLRHIVFWWRENTGIVVPTGWAICDGTAWASIPNDMGLSSGAIPDLISRFLLPVGLASLGTTGGSNTRNLEHTHPVGAHQHSIPAHSHGGSTDNNGGSTSGSGILTVTPDGSHRHDFGGGSYSLASRPGAGGNSSYQSLYLTGFNSGGGSSAFIDMDNAGNHIHLVPDHSHTVNAHSHPIPAESLTTSSDGSGTTGNSTGSILTSINIQPAYYGVVPLMKVQNS